MNRSSKINEIVYRLRKAKGLTQKELATRLHVTAKTISNWERGRNFVPAEMFSAIIKEFGVDKTFMFDNFAKSPSQSDEIRFFYCHECKSVFWSFSKTSRICCNKTLEPLIATPENSSHYVCVESDIETDIITLSTYHPQTSDHRIEFVAYVSEKDVHVFVCLENKPLNISIPHVRGGEIYFFCSKHGLFNDKMLY